MFVTSTEIQVDTFAPVFAELERRGISATFLCLDAYYGWRSADAWQARGVSPRILPARREIPADSFYRRCALSVWRDVIAARSPVRRELERSQPSAVVLGNDKGLIEKLLVAETHRLGLPVVLVQDGFLSGEEEDPPAERRALLRFAAERVASRIVVAAGYPYLASTTYGLGRADVVCATGEDSRRLFVRLGVPASKVVVTGQPRYDYILGKEPVRGQNVIFCSTPFASAGLGNAAYERQMLLVSALGKALQATDRRFLLKPHPREDARELDAGLSNARVAIADGPVAGILQHASVAIVGISSVLEEAVLMRVPVIVPGRAIYGDRFEESLPPASAFPRFESAADGVRLVERLDDREYRTELIERQARALCDRVRFGPGTASALVADVIQAQAVKKETQTVD
jgi:hypothetical protein